VRHWISIGRRPMPMILRRSTASIARTPCWITRSQASEPAVEATYRTVLRIIGSGDLWVTELILTYDGKPTYTVSIMEFEGDKVARETQYFADPFVAPAFRAQWIERMDT
jgi:hypothetical protein